MRAWALTTLCLMSVTGLFAATPSDASTPEKVPLHTESLSRSAELSAAPKRVALIVGNADYSWLPKLSNSVNDAEDVGSELKSLGFEVILLKNAGLEEFEAGLSRFMKVSQDAGISLFFYSGNGVENRSGKYLIPTDLKIEQSDVLEARAVNLDEVQNAMKLARGARAIIIDACRNNLSGRWRTDGAPEYTNPIVSFERGDTALLFSTQSGSIALDGDPKDRHSPFTQALLEQLAQPGPLKLNLLLTRVASTVREATKGRQSPELVSSISPDFEISPTSERAYWEKVRGSQDFLKLRDFISRFPASPFRLQAEAEARQLEEAEVSRRKSADQERVCTEDAARLEALRVSRAQNRMIDIQEVTASPSTCARVRDAANVLLVSLREEEAQIMRAAQKAKICAAEAKDLDLLVAQGARAALETMGRSRQCETLNVAAALANLDEIERGRKQQVTDSVSTSVPHTSTLRNRENPKDRRVAIVFGNSNYERVSFLPNPRGDAELVAATLEAQGFVVILVRDATRAAMLQALNEFNDRADQADWALVYFAGHGIEIGGIDYLLPVDARLKVDRDAQDEAVSVNRVLDSVEKARKLRLVILDACRDNPFATTMRRSVSLRSVSRGLAPVQPQAGIMVVYAAAAGEVAQDGVGDHSPFTTALVRRLKEPGLEVSRLFNVVTADVLDATERRQRPFEYGSNPGREELFFEPPLPVEKPSSDLLSEERVWSYLVYSSDQNVILHFRDSLLLDNPLRSVVENRLKELQSKKN